MKCGIVKDLEDFHNKSANKDGKDNRCKECANLRNRELYNSDKGYKEKRIQRLIGYGTTYNDKMKSRSRDWYNTSRGRAKSLMKGILKRYANYQDEEPDFDYTYLQELIERGYCEVSGLPFALGSVGDGHKRAFSPSVDRIDNSRGYSKDNIRMVIWQVNLMKGELSDELLLDMCYAVIANLEKGI